MNSVDLLDHMVKLILLVAFCWLAGCKSVAPYQRVYLNDEDMMLQQRPSAFNEINAANYREGAAGAIGGKSGGGCGCN